MNGDASVRRRRCYRSVCVFTWSSGFICAGYVWRQASSFEVFASKWAKEAPRTIVSDWWNVKMNRKSAFSCLPSGSSEVRFIMGAFWRTRVNGIECLCECVCVWVMEAPAKLWNRSASPPDCLLSPCFHLKRFTSGSPLFAATGCHLSLHRAGGNRREDLDMHMSTSREGRLTNAALTVFKPRLEIGESLDNVKLWNQIQSCKLAWNHRKSLNYVVVQFTREQH